MIRGVLALLCASALWSSTARSESLSIGSPVGGRIAEAVELLPSRALSVRPGRAHFAVPDLVDLLGRAAIAVRQHSPDSRLLVGDLSLRQGGALPGHQSHASGRDADVGFYYLDDDDELPVRTSRFWRVEDDGSCPDEPGLRFDAEANWRLIEALITDRQALVSRIYVAAPIRKLLLDQARESGVRPYLLRRAAYVLRADPRHDNHFHVRIACPRRMARTCYDGRPPTETARRTVPLRKRSTQGFVFVSAVTRAPAPKR